MKTKSLILIAISLGFGLVAVLGMSHLIARNKNPTEDLTLVPVLVAKQDIRIGKEITADMVEMKNFRPATVPEIAARSIEDINEMRALENISQGNFISKSKITHKNKYISVSIPKGYTVVATKPDLESTAHNSLSPGDRIDVIAILRHPETKQQMAKTFLKNIKVFGINDQTTRQHRNEPINIKIVQVLVRPRQAEMLALVESVGKLRFVRIGGDETVVDLKDQDLDEDDGSEGPASIDRLFATGSTISRAQQQITIDEAVAQTKTQNTSQAGEQFIMTVHSSEGPVEYLWNGSNSLPIKRGSDSEDFGKNRTNSNSSITEEQDTGTKHQTFPPELLESEES